MKKCPFCAEEIQDEAIKCRFCGEFLNKEHIPEKQQDLKQTKIAEEKTLWANNPSLNYFISNILWGLIILIIGLIVLFTFSSSNDPYVKLIKYFLSSFGFIYLIYIFIKKNSIRYTITNKRVIVKWGILSCYTKEVNIYDIRLINLNQSFGEKLWGIGSVQIASAGTAGIEITMVGLSNPAEIRDFLRRLKDDPSYGDTLKKVK